MRKYTQKLPSPYPDSPVESTAEEEVLTDEARIVAVGASAGGLEALKAFFEGLPKNDSNAYVVIQHLSPDYKSMMAELLKKSTDLPIVEIALGMKVLPGHVYLIPPSSNLVLKEDVFELVEKPGNQTLNLPIDIFFESLSKYKKDLAIGVILSGTGSDGTRGARAIKEHNGMIMVQAPEQAQFNGMPQSAVDTGLVDYVLPVEEMGKELQNFLAAPSVFKVEEGVESDRNELMKILSFVDQKTGLDFREYKPSTLVRRVARRVKVCKCQSLSEYYGFLHSDKKEVDILYHEFLIGVTKFFRDPEVWATLKKDVIPELVRNKNNGDTIKIWDAGCSTGEEAYSFAMCFFEEMERQEKNLDLKIFATDISDKHLEIGSMGYYPDSIAADVSPEFLAKYFISRSTNFRIAERLRNAVVFSKHNIIKNPPFSNMDLVACRNLLIYFQPSIQKKALHMLHYSLKQNGILVLGTSESLDDRRDDFEEIDRKSRIYRNEKPKTRLTSDISPLSTHTIREQSRRERTHVPAKENPLQQRLKDELHESILEQFGAAALLVDSDFNIMEAMGEFRKYANLPTTGFSINLLDMVSEDLKYILQSSLKKAEKQSRKIYYKAAVVSHGDTTKKVDITLKPVDRANPELDRNFVVTFVEKEMNLDGAEIVDNVTPTRHTHEYVRNLEEELKQTKQELQTSLEEIETSNEELQAANEELLASNEELQSTNEELQSVNEEINTVNAENIQKMDDLAALNADMNNLLVSTQIGTIFLDSDLRIRKFTPAIKQHFSLINTDLGRPISHFIGAMGRNRLLNRCKQVLATGKTEEKRVVSREGKHYLRRISPYVDSRDEINGVVVTFIDIEGLQKSREKLLASERRYKSFYDEDPVMHLSVDPSTNRIVHCNEMAYSSLGYDSKEELIGLSVFDLYPEDEQVRALRNNQEFRENGKLMNLEQNLKTKSGDNLPVILNATAEADEEDNILTVRYTCADISALKKAEQKLKEQAADLQRANRDLEQFVSICSHDLQEPLSTIKFGSDILGKIYADKLDEKGRNYIQYLKEASKRLSGQIKALLEHSRIGRNGDMTLVNTKEVVEVVKYDLGKRIKDTKAKIHVGTLPTIRGYEVELRLLFQNLITNAIKYTPADRNPLVRISAYQEGDYWIFSVVDNGMGISEEDQQTIFTIFNRANVQDDEGTGVGLAHVEKIVQLHEGTVWVNSQVGVGSTFYFKLKA